VLSRSAQVSRARPFYASFAEAYDLLITDPVEPWISAVDARLRANGDVGQRLLDAGCGTGRHAAALISLGYDVELADASPEMLRLAAKRCPTARTHLLGRVPRCIRVRVSTTKTSTSPRPTVGFFTFWSSWQPQREAAPTKAGARARFNACTRSAASRASRTAC
jgi:Methyltransferase domain